jgi:hypothetical protein
MAATGGGQGDVSTGRPPTFSFLIPTHRGRPPWRCLDSLLPQLDRGDEVIVIGDTHDGPLPRVRQLVEGYDSLAPVGSFRYLELDAGAHDYGHSQLNYGLEHASGEWLHCNDDDDIYAPGAVATMRQAAHISGGRPLLFRFQSYHRGVVFWVERGRLERHWIGGHCLVTPNVPGKVGRWGPSYQGDFDWIESTIAQHVGWLDQLSDLARRIIAIRTEAAILGGQAWAGGRTHELGDRRPEAVAIAARCSPCSCWLGDGGGRPGQQFCCDRRWSGPGPLDRRHRPVAGRPSARGGRGSTCHGQRRSSRCCLARVLRWAARGLFGGALDLRHR